MVNSVVISVFSAGLIAQVMKIITSSFKTKRFNIQELFNMGGMPSAHSALVSSLAMGTGLTEGFDSNMFWIVLVFALVIMYDAMGVRRAAGVHGKVLNKLVKRNNLKTKKLNERLGHSPFEVIIGSLLGILCAIYFTVFFIL